MRRSFEFLQKIVVIIVGKIGQLQRQRFKNSRKNAKLLVFYLFCRFFDRATMMVSQ